MNIDNTEQSNLSSSEISSLQQNFENLTLNSSNNSQQTAETFKKPVPPSATQNESQPGLLQSIAPPQISSEDPSKLKIKIGYCFDERMLLHKDYSYKHQESPERAMAIYMNLLLKNIAQKLIRIPSNISSESDITSIHTKEYYDTIYNLQFEKNTQTKRNIFETKKTLKERDTYDNCYTYESAMFAVGSLINVCKYVMNNQVNHAFAIIRPPGHHADTSNCHGFCVFNSVAIATEFIKKTYPGNKIAILDWDVHHGDGTQKIFYKQNNPLFISIHRHDGGKFYPFVTGFMNEFGEGEGTGFNVNIPLDTKVSISNAYSCIGDAEYIYLFDNIVMPILDQYCPNVVIVSCGFDAGENDFSGCLKCTPITYSYMTKRLLEGNRKIIFALEGGYTLDTLQRCSESIFRTLIGEDVPFNGLMIQNYKEINNIPDTNCYNKLFDKFTLDRIIKDYKDIFHPVPYVVEQLNRIIENHSQYWSCLKDKKIDLNYLVNQSKYLRNINESDNSILKEKLKDNIWLMSEEEFLKKYDDFIIFKVGKKIISDKIKNDIQSEDNAKLNKYYRKKIKEMRILLNELNFNIESVKFTKLRANASKMVKYLNWNKDEMKYDLNSFFVSQILTLFFQHLNMKSEEVLKKIDQIISKIKNTLDNKIDLFNCNLILCPFIKVPTEEKTSINEKESTNSSTISTSTNNSKKESIRSKIKKQNRFKKNQNEVVFDFFIDGAKSNNILCFDDDSISKNENNFLNGLISIRDYIKENVMI